MAIKPWLHLPLVHTILNMANKWRRRTRQKDDNFQYHGSNRQHNSSNDVTGIDDVRLGRHRISKRHTNANPNPSRLNNNESQRARRSSAHYIHAQTAIEPFQRTRLNTAALHTENVFPFRSSHFKEYFLNAMREMLLHIQLWCPEEGAASEDGMDWQHESELVIPQPSMEIRYNWDSKP